MEFRPMIILAQKGSKLYPNTTLPVTLWFYDDEHHLENVVYMQNNYDRYTTGEDLVPILIDKTNPHLLSDTKLLIRDKDFKTVLAFIKSHYEPLMNLVNNIKIDYTFMEFTCINRFKPTVIDGFFVEQLHHLHTTLPVTLYCYCNTLTYDDDRNMYSLLMENNYDDSGRLTNCVTVTIDKDNPHLAYDVELGISIGDFEKVRTFIKDHYKIFNKFIKGRITSYDLHRLLETQ